ncbi:lipid IV(A) 3-deoxy-D-manno-octulosonic acid transferase [Gynuella sunshinyii]|uniref:lipid IV(A) 3-deoxy-D-manno-octulosonic acid transferase n=1 Tax=Gynuella sunshinyii TaxID=1445505 RepID=UPI0005CBBA28|nr:lipid IV(A) 3-deoxy-D-manno-octulosonic acid transferase [Gynuella sunshinyii]
MLRRLYTFLLTLLLPFIFMRLWLKSRSSPGYGKGWSERLGKCVVPEHRAVIWFHAVSLGESVAATPLIERCQQELASFEYLITNTTATGAEYIQKHFGNSVFHQYLPYDHPWIVRRFLRKLAPKILVIMETEMWPNLLHECDKKNITVLLANGRMNPKSAGRYLKAPALTEPMFAAIQKVAVQTESDYQQFVRLGFASEQLILCGNLKFDQALDEDKIIIGKQWYQQWQRPVWIAASTHQGEEDLALEVHKRLLQSYPDLLLILVPRHPERFDMVANKVESYGLNFVRHGQEQIPQSDTQVFLGDTLGQLISYYQASDICFVGGSLVPVGGHNPLEPAALGKPVLMGPETFKCEDICKQLSEAGGLVRVRTDSLFKEVDLLLQSPARREQLAEAGKQMVDRSRGAVIRQFHVIEEMLR